MQLLDQQVRTFFLLARRALEPIRALVAHDMRDLPMEIELADAIGATGFEFVGRRCSHHKRRGCEHAGYEGEPKANLAHVHCRGYSCRVAGNGLNGTLAARS